MWTTCATPARGGGLDERERRQRVAPPARLGLGELAVIGRDVRGGVDQRGDAVEDSGVPAVVERPPCALDADDRRARPHQRAHRELALAQVREQPATDEAGGAGDRERHDLPISSPGSSTVSVT